eukprot:scaffold42330_cov28-Tisochrysis_lutea.AAC.1
MLAAAPLSIEQDDLHQRQQPPSHGPRGVSFGESGEGGDDGMPGAVVDHRNDLNGGVDRDEGPKEDRSGAEVVVTVGSRAVGDSSRQNPDDGKRWVDVSLAALPSSQRRHGSSQEAQEKWRLADALTHTSFWLAQVRPQSRGISRARPAAHLHLAQGICTRPLLLLHDAKTL